MKQKTKLEIINETVEYYGADPSKRGVKFENGVQVACRYLTIDGKMCAVGRCMKEPTIDMSGAISCGGIYLTDTEALVGYTQPVSVENYLKEEYRGHGDMFWSALQSFHDDISNWTATGLSSVGENYLNYLKKVYSDEK